MKITKIIFTVVLLAIIVACSKATSKIQYKYRKSPGNGVAAKIGNIEITEKELNQTIETELYKKELELFEIKFNRLNSLIVEKLMKADPASKGLTNDQYLEKYITSKIDVSEKDLKDFIKQQGVPESQAKDPRIKERIVQYITAQKKKTALEKWIGEKTQKSGVEVYFEKPTPPSYEIEIGDAPFYGDEDAKVTIVEFSDFQCPYCAKAAAVIKKLKSKYGKKVKIVFKQFPLAFHNHAKSAAIASMCANEQGMDKFWKMHDAFFLDKAPLADDKIIELSSKLGLKKDQFESCFKNKKFMAHVERDLQQGQALGVKGTPSVFINGMLFVDTLNFDKYVEFIDEQLKI